MKRFCSKITLLFFAALLAAGATASAYDSNAVTTNLEAQHYTNYCWAACTKACVYFYNPVTAVTQEQINHHINSDDSDPGAIISDISNAINWAGLSSLYTPSSNTMLTYATTVAEIDAGRPMVVQTQRSGLSSTSHAVLAMSYYTASSGKQYIGYKDPSPVYTGAGDSAYRNTIYASLDVGYYGGFLFVDLQGNTRTSVGYVYSIAD